METLNITIHALSEKRNELLRTCRSIMEQTRQDNNCSSSVIRQHDNDGNIIVLEQIWSHWEAVKRFLQSDNFTVLLGAMKLLGKSYKIRINDSSQTEGLKLVEAVLEHDSFKASR